eukprot:365763-Chlamydomonas_euryale.AAC.5
MHVKTYYTPSATDSLLSSYNPNHMHPFKENSVRNVKGTYLAQYPAELPFGCYRHTFPTPAGACALGRAMPPASFATAVPDPLEQQPNLSKMESFSYKSHSCALYYQSWRQKVRQQNG